VTDKSSLERQRLDKWLWHARVVKTRTLAQKLVNGGKVRVNKEKVLSASTTVKVGDGITITLRNSVRVLKVAGFCERRGSAAMAQALFEDLSAPDAGTNPQAGSDKNGASPTETGGKPAGPEPQPVHPGGEGVGRPDKRDRKKMADLKKITET